MRFHTGLSGQIIQTSGLLALTPLDVCAVLSAKKRKTEIGRNGCLAKQSSRLLGQPCGATLVPPHKPEYTSFRNTLLCTSLPLLVEPLLPVVKRTDCQTSVRGLRRHVSAAFPRRKRSDTRNNVSSKGTQPLWILVTRQ